LGTTAPANATTIAATDTPTGPSSSSCSSTVVSSTRLGIWNAGATQRAIDAADHAESTIGINLTLRFGNWRKTSSTERQTERGNKNLFHGFPLNNQLRPESRQVFYSAPSEASSTRAIFCSKTPFDT
jgi:hypothetical protein